MTALPECPELECWQALFDEAVPAEQRDRFERHLESCPTCQAKLDRAGDGGDAVLPLLRLVGDTSAEYADPGLRHVMERLREVTSVVRPAPGEPADLYFLRPSSQPGVLGTLGNYEVLEVVGQGGMGVVLKAYEPALNRFVAVKVLAAAVAGSATARLRFTREAKAAAAVCHDHVVPVYAVHEADGLPYFVMQYVEGESLQDRLDRDGPLPVEEVVRIGHQTAAGLAAAHAQGLIHRDIKPANLLLENGVARVKITDFGLARMADDAGLTRDGVVAGTPEYMAPEQARGEPVDHRADLFSLGSVLYACCTGASPFCGTAALAVLRQVSEQTPPPVRRRNPEVPAWLEAVIARLLARDPAERFQTAAEVAALLEGYLAHMRQPARVSAPRLPPAAGQRQRAARRRRFWFWGAATALVAAAALVAVAWPGAAPPTNRQTAQVKPACGTEAPARPLALPEPGAPQAQPAGVPQAPQPAGGAAAPALRTEYPQEYHPDFKSSAGAVPGLLVHGPDAPDCVKFEPEGIHIALPPTYPRQRPGTGVVTDFGVHGDFEITVGFEILGEPRGGAWGNPTELQLVVVPNEAPQPGKWQKANQNYARLSRQAPRWINVRRPPSTMPPRQTHPTVAQAIASQVGAPFGVGAPMWPQALVALRVATLGAFVRALPPDEAQKLAEVMWVKDPGAFFVDFTRWNNENVPQDQWGNEQYNTIEVHHPSPLFAAAASTGRLRLVRNGPTLYYLKSEPPAADFRLLNTSDFGTEDLKNVRVLGSTGGPGATFDVRVTDLSIRAEGLPKLPAAAVLPAADGRKWPLALLVLAGLVAAVAVSLGTWYYTRTRRRLAPAGPAPAAAPPEARGIVFKCPGCGKRLRARADQAGSRPKCPQCGKEVVVPSVLPKKPEEQR